ncbi:hypothetical protein ABID65_008126 [Bradyrhizobium sp. S3.9.2]
MAKLGAWLVSSRNPAGAVATLPLQRPDFALLGADLARIRRSRSGSVEFHRVLRSSGTSPNFRISLASLKSPLDGSPVREKAMAPA